jgi:hypothetical protein
VDPRRGLLVGREPELAEIAACLDEAAGGRAALALVTGEPGIGKTRLLEEAARRATARGFAVAWGRAWEVGGAPAYWPWIEALRALLARPGAQGDAAAELTRLLPELGRGPGASAAADRFQLWDAVGAFLQAAAAREPILVVLDDLHAADPSSLHLTEAVVRQLRDARAVVLASHRDVEARLAPELDACLSRLGRDGRVLHLPRLSAPQVGALVREVTGRDDEEMAQLVHDASEGNPLFARELLRLMAARGAASPTSVPEGVRAVIRQRLALLSPATVALLSAAAAVGRDFALPVAAEVAGVTTEALAEALAEAETAELLSPAGASGRYRFSHVLVAETLTQDLPAPRRARLHARTAEVLERLHAGDPAAPLAEIAHHWLAAGAEAAPRAAAAAQRAAERATLRLAFEDAVHLYARALEALAVAAPGDARRRAELLVAQGEAALRAGERDEARRACQAAAELARALGSGELLAAAALTWGAEFVTGVVDASLVGLLEEALAALPPGDGALRARVMARLAGALQPAPDPRQPVALAREAIAMAERLGDDAVRLQVLHAGMAALMDYVPPAERSPLNQEVARLASAAGARPLALRARLRLAFDRLEDADLAGYDAAVAAYEALASEFRQPRYHWPTALLRSARAYWQGRFAEGERLEAEARALAERARDENAARSLLYRRVVILAQTGRDRELDAALDAVFDALPTAALLRAAMQGWVAARVGDLARARREIATIGVDEIAAAAADMNIAAFLAEAVTATGDRERATRLYAALLPRAGRVCVASGVGFAVQDLDDRSLLGLATVLGRWDDADRHAASALEVCQRLGARPWATRVKLDWARSLLARGGEAARTRARALAGEALAEAEALGIATIVEQCRALLGDEPAAAPAPVDGAADAAPERTVAMALEGEYWTIRGAGETCRLRDSRGLRMLAVLVGEPGREHHVLDLGGGGGGDGVVDAGDAGETLDREARAAYQARLRELREELDEAQGWNDAGRRERLERELELLTRELAGAVGLGGRERRAGRAAERARVNVQRRVTDALRRIAEAAPRLGKHLTATVRTGTFCAYVPDEPRARR